MIDVLIRFAHISDTHFAPEGHTHAIDDYSDEVKQILAEHSENAPQREMVPVLSANRALVEAVNKIEDPIDFVLHTGDVNTDPEGPDHYELTRDVMKDIKYPIHYLPGNHDNVSDLQSVVVGTDDIKIPYEYTFEVNGVQIICLDTATHGINHGGRLSDEQIQWLDEQIGSDDARPLVVAIHHPMLKFGHKLLDFFGTSNGDEVHQVLVKAVPRLRGVFFGHIHQDFETYMDGVLYSSVQSPQVEFGHESSFQIVTVSTTGTHIKRVKFSVG